MNRKLFFDSVRGSLFKGALAPSQVHGMDAILDIWDQLYRRRTSLPQLANCLGTAFHETAFTMQPIKEYGGKAYFTRMYDITGARPEMARRLGNVHAGDGARFCGRGYVQLTGRGNYTKATAKLKALGFIAPDVDFALDPDQVMQARIAALIMFEGMEEGWFTGVKLDAVVDDNIDGDEHADFIKARRIINGTDRAEKIAEYSDKFLAALKAAP